MRPASPSARSEPQRTDGNRAARHGDVARKRPGDGAAVGEQLAADGDDRVVDDVDVTAAAVAGAARVDPALSGDRHVAVGRDTDIAAVAFATAGVDDGRRHSE